MYNWFDENALWSESHTNYELSSLSINIIYKILMNFNETIFEIIEIIEMIEKRKNNAYRKVNEEMILLYLEVGKFLYELKENSNYGDKITTKASDFMKNNYPTIK